MMDRTLCIEQYTQYIGLSGLGWPFFDFPANIDKGYGLKDEKYCNSNKYYIVTSAINYLKSNEIAIINGIITVKLTP